MSILRKRRFLNAIIFSSILLPVISFSQVTIKEKVEIKPQPSSRPVRLADAPVLAVTSSFAGVINDTFPSLVYVKGPCNIGAGVSGASGSLSVAACEGVYQAGYRFTTYGAGQFTFAVLLGNSTLLKIDQSLDAHVTAWSQFDIPLCSGLSFSEAYDRIGLTESNYFTAAAVSSDTACAIATWSPILDINLEITKGQDIGEFLGRNGEPAGNKTKMRVDDPWYTPIFVVDGTIPYGTVEVTATSGDLTIVKTFQVLPPAPRVQINPPWISLWPIEVSLSNKPVLDFSESHYPNPGDQYEPTITWDPGSTINTADYYDQISDTLSFYVKVRAENPGGVAVDSSLVTLVKRCIKVTFDPPQLSSGQRADLSFQWVNPDGSLEEIPGGQYVFSAQILGGDDSSKGLLVSGSDTATTLMFKDYIQFVAPASFQGSQLTVQVAGSADWNGGGATSVVRRGMVMPANQRFVARLAGKEGEIEAPSIRSAGIKKPSRKEDIEATKRIAHLSSSCPINQVVVQKPTLKIVDHSPWTIWPSLPWLQTSKGGWVNTGSNRPGYNPKRGMKIQVSDPSKQPIKNVQVKVLIEFVQGSGGHQHDSGIKVLPQNKQVSIWPGSPEHNPVTLLTNDDGLITIDSLVASQVSGEYLITAMFLSDATVRDTVNLQVKVPGLVNLRDYRDATFDCSQTPTGTSNHPDNNWCAPEMVNSLTMAIADFYAWSASSEGGGVAIKTSVNDLSLIWGGDFDIGADWDFDAVYPASPKHSLHRAGLSVDINKASLSGDDLDELTKTMDHHHLKRIYEPNSIHFEMKGGN